MVFCDIDLLSIIDGNIISLENLSVINPRENGY